jgi:ribosomal protein L16 Arg81 hydroxylase
VPHANWTFASILRPVDPEAFRTDYWAKQILHLARSRADFYSGLITLGEIERHLAMQEFFSRHSITTPKQGYGIPDPLPASLSEVHQRIMDGSSLRIRRMECFLDPGSPAMSLIRDIVSELQHPLDSFSCYVARSGAEGLGPHHDETEIFTLQISGQKRWRIYHRSLSDCAATYDPQRLGNPSRELILEAGDLLYVPRGFVHDVTSEQGAFSLTIVFDPFKWDSVIHMLSARLATTEQFHAAMPAGVFTGNTRLEKLRQEMESRLASMRAALESVTAEELAEMMAKKLFARMMWPPIEQMQSILNLETIDLDTVLERREEIPYHLALQGDHIRLLLPGGYTIQTSARAEAALRNVLETVGPFRVSEMHESLNNDSKLALARQLIGCGLLTPVRDSGR